MSDIGEKKEDFYSKVLLSNKIKRKKNVDVNYVYGLARLKMSVEDNSREYN